MPMSREDMVRRSTRTGCSPSFENFVQKDPPGFLVKIAPGKGLGLFTSQPFQKGSFLVTYPGELITAKEGELREAKGESGFRYFFRYGEKKWCVDATTESQTGPKLGRLANHGMRGEINAKMLIKTFDSKPILCLYATKDIEKDSEVLYDYGIKNLPWVKQVNTESHNEEIVEEPCKDAVAFPLGFETEHLMESSAPPEPDQTKAPDELMLCEPHSSVEEPANTENNTEERAEEPSKDAAAFPLGFETEQLMESSAPPEPDQMNTADDLMLSEPHSSVEEPVNTENDTEERAEEPLKDAAAFPLGFETEQLMESSAPPEPDQMNTADDLMLSEPHSSVEEPVNTENSTEERAEEPSEDAAAFPLGFETEQLMESSAPPEPNHTNTADDVMLREPQPSVEELFNIQNPTLMEEGVDSTFEDTPSCSKGYQDGELLASDLDDGDDSDDPEYEQDEIVPPSDDSNISCVLYPHLTLTEQKQNEQEKDRKTCGERLSNITVKSTNNDDGRVYDKRQFCFYCKQPQAKLPRHLRSAHCDESAVADWMSEKNKSLKSAKLAKLRNLGNHFHNCSVLEEGSGELIVKYRPTETTDASDFVPCPTCYGYYAKRFLFKHSCPLEGGANGDKQPKNKRGERVRRGELLLPNPQSSYMELDELFSKLKSDAISRVVKSDSLICELAKKEYLKLGHDKEQQSYIRTKLREMGRLLIEVRLICNEPSSELADFIQPAKFDQVVTAARNVAGFDTQTHLYKVPSLALKIGHSIKKCAVIIKAQGLKLDDENMIKNAAHFLELCDLKWTEEVSSHAHRTMTENKRNAVKRLPLTEDICTLTEYLKKVEDEQKRKLKDGKFEGCEASWKILNEVTLTQMLLFNRRRQGEVSKISIYDYNKKSTSETVDYIYASLSKFERELCKSFKRIEIIGKKGNTVPVLLTKHMEESLDLLISLRQEVGVNKDNNFLFPYGQCNSEGHIRGADCIRKYATLCGAKNPSQLRSTSLRKHVATISQVLNLKDNELDILARFMGHDVRVHREYYRLPDATLQVAKISKLLISLEKGSTASLAGKGLDEIEMSMDDDIEDLEGRSDTDEEEEEEGEGGEEKDEEEVESGEKGPETSGDSSSHAHGSTTESASDTSSGDEGPPIKKQKGQKYQRRIWTEDEKAIVLKEFRCDIALNRLPGKRAIDRVLSKYRCLDGRKWTSVKDFIRNYTRKANKK